MTDYNPRYARASCKDRRPECSQGLCGQLEKTIAALEDFYVSYKEAALRLVEFALRTAEPEFEKHLEKNPHPQIRPSRYRGVEIETEDAEIDDTIMSLSQLIECTQAHHDSQNGDAERCQGLQRVTGPCNGRVAAQKAFCELHSFQEHHCTYLPLGQGRVGSNTCGERCETRPETMTDAMLCSEHLRHIEHEIAKAETIIDNPASRNAVRYMETFFEAYPIGAEVPIEQTMLDDCGICWNPLLEQMDGQAHDTSQASAVANPVRRLHVCSHQFHNTCIVHWLSTAGHCGGAARCPSSRREVFPPMNHDLEDYVEADDDDSAWSDSDYESLDRGLARPVNLSTFLRYTDQMADLQDVIREAETYSAHLPSASDEWFDVHVKIATTRAAYDEVFWLQSGGIELTPVHQASEETQTAGQPGMAEEEETSDADSASYVDIILD